MATWFENWLKRQRQGRGFHPSWILIGVIATLLIGALVWLPAEWMAKSEYKRMPPVLRAHERTGNPVPHESMPMGMPAIEQAPDQGSRLIRVGHPDTVRGAASLHV